MTTTTKRKAWGDMTAREAAKALAERMSRPLHPYQPDEESLSSEREYWKRVQALDKERSRPYSAEELEAMALRAQEQRQKELRRKQHKAERKQRKAARHHK